MVHTYARTYSTASGDSPDQLFDLQTGAESNWSLEDDGVHESFVVLHNGPLAAPPGEVELEAVDPDGRRLPIRVPLAAEARVQRLGLFPASSPTWPASWEVAPAG